LGIVKAVKRFLARRKILQQMKVSADALRNAKQGTPEGQYRTSHYIPGTKGDLAWHLNRSLFPAIKAECRLSDAEVSRIIFAVANNTKTQDAFYGFVKLGGRQKDAARTTFIIETNRVLVTKGIPLGPRVKGAVNMVMQHHNH
jgi:hypothetical protein